ncbi:DNA-directed RNA polymerase subunit alpha, partial [Dehalococcoidia bacterium]|nr:DNA-directed RNA polymerase subunit alpha [Dehalococcoidia bacterium]
GEVLEKEESELLQIRNFGEKSLRELNAKLHEMGFVTEETMEQTDLEAENMDVPASGQEDEMASPGEGLEASE